MRLGFFVPVVIGYLASASKRLPRPPSMAHSPLEAMLTFLVLGAGIGFAAGVSPGPVLTLVVTETLKSGWLRGAAVAAGPLLADGPIVLMAVTVFSDLPPAVVPAISVVGGVFLLYLAVTNAVGARRATLPTTSAVRPGRGGLVTGLLARALSPHPYLFWFLVGAPALTQARSVGWAAVAAFLVGYYATIVGSNVGLALALNHWMRVLSDRIYRGILLAASALLAVYGLILVSRRNA
jgi:threonine/homoserine/homoserine lactone efflux protein